MKWKSYLILSLLSTTNLIGCAQKNRAATSAPIADGIIGGTTVSAHDPLASHVVALLDVSQGALCTASIIDVDLLVTAAHCVEGGAAALRAVFSTNINNQGAAVITVLSAQQSPGWAQHQNDATNTGDIALVKLAQPIPAGYAPAKLLDDASFLTSGQAVILAGYGITNGTRQTGAGILRQVTTVIADPVFSDTEVLMQQTRGKGACHGDSGGPAYVQVNGERRLLGVTSRGVNDPRNNCTKYSAYTNILSYRDWISSTAQAMATASQSPVVSLTTTNN